MLLNNDFYTAALKSYEGRSLSRFNSSYIYRLAYASAYALSKGTSGRNPIGRYPMGIILSGNFIFGTDKFHEHK
jgi:hypothetical protein